MMIARTPSPFQPKRLGRVPRPATPRPKALSHKGRGGRGDVRDCVPQTPFPSPLVGEGFAPYERSELGATGEGVPRAEDNLRPAA
jgi:hypothetical protein